MTDLPRLGVVIVTYAAEEVIGPCIDSLTASQGVALDIVVVDNASPDATVAEVHTLHCPPPHRLRLIEAGRNGGFAAGVNIGLNELPEAERIWILNPDCTVGPDTAYAFATHPGGFGMLAGRVVYAEAGTVQADGGVIDRRTGVVRNLSMGQPADAPFADPAEFDFVLGANMVVSRAFLDQAGPMPEHYFLYYEEVAWALQRGDLPIAFCEGGTVLHAGGHSIGSGRPEREPSALSVWFLHRNRQRFAAEWYGRHLLPRLWTLAKAGQCVTRRQFRSAFVLIRVALGLPAPRSVRDRVPEGVA